MIQTVKTCEDNYCSDCKKEHCHPAPFGYQSVVEESPKHCSYLYVMPDLIRYLPIEALTIIENSTRLGNHQFWIDNKSHETNSKKQMKSADIIVIGGGMAGISAASRLSEQANVIVLEAESQPGYHSTSRSAAMFILNYGNQVLRGLNRHSKRLYNELEQILGKGSLLNPRGDLMIAGTDEAEQFDHYLGNSTGLDIIDVDEAVELCPALRKDKVHKAAIERDAADIDVDALLQYYIRMLKTNNGRVEYNCKVESLIHKNNHWQVSTSNSLYSAPIIVNAAGAWADQVASLAGLDPVGLTPKRRSAVLIKVPDYKNVDDWPLVLSASESWYAKPQSGLLIVSPADEDPVQPHDAWPEDIVLAEGIDRFQQFMDIEVNHIEYSWAGLRTFAPDKNPVVGFSSQAEGFFWLAGQGGYGIQTAPVLAQLSADLILNRTPHISDELVQALSPDRFKQA